MQHFNSIDDKETSQLIQTENKVMVSEHDFEMLSFLRINNIKIDHLRDFVNKRYANPHHPYENVSDDEDSSSKNQNTSDNVCDLRKNRVSHTQSSEEIRRDLRSKEEPSITSGMISRMPALQLQQQTSSTDLVDSLTNQQPDTTQTQRENYWQPANTYGSNHSPFTKLLTTLEEVEKTNPQLLPFYINDIKKLLDNDQSPSSTPSTPLVSQEEPAKNSMQHANKQMPLRKRFSGSFVEFSSDTARLSTPPKNTIEISDKENHQDKVTIRDRHNVSYSHVTQNTAAKPDGLENHQDKVTIGDRHNVSYSHVTQNTAAKPDGLENHQDKVTIRDRHNVSYSHVTQNTAAKPSLQKSTPKETQTSSNSPTQEQNNLCSTTLLQPSINSKVSYKNQLTAAPSVNSDTLHTSSQVHSTTTSPMGLPTLNDVHKALVNQEARKQQYYRRFSQSQGIQMPRSYQDRLRPYYRYQNSPIYPHNQTLKLDDDSRQRCSQTPDSTMGYSNPNAHNYYSPYMSHVNQNVGQAGDYHQPFRMPYVSHHQYYGQQPLPSGLGWPYVNWE